MPTPPPPPEFFALRERALAPMAHAAELSLQVPEPRHFGWAERLGLALHAALARRVPIRVDSEEWRDGRTYNWRSDHAWLDDAGGGVLVAKNCFGGSPGDGVDIVVHAIAPGARVVFEEGTDYTQLAVRFRIAADDAERLADVRETTRAVAAEHGCCP